MFPFGAVLGGFFVGGAIGAIADSGGELALGLGAYAVSVILRALDEV